MSKTKGLVLIGLTAFAMLIVSIQGPAMAWGGYPPKPPKGVTPDTGCSADATPGGDYGTIYYATGSYVNVRQSPSTSACVITQLGYEENVVADPSVSPVQSGGYTWVKVAYFLGHCQTCTNYDWNNTGWVATANLAAATNEYTCEQSAGCSEVGGSGAISGFPPFPETSSACSAFASQHPGYACHWYSYHANYNGGVEEATLDPDQWHATQNCSPELGCGWVWNYDWWAH